MKFLPLSAALSAAITFIPGLQASTNAQEHDYVCFLTTQSGKVVDLSDSLCEKKSTPAVSTDNDQAFIEDYKRNAMQYPEVRDNLLASAQESPEQSISHAKRVCNDLQAGLSFNEMPNQGGEIDQKTAIVNTAIINTLASKYYCPEVKGES